MKTNLRACNGLWRHEEGRIDRSKGQLKTGGKQPNVLIRWKGGRTVNYARLSQAHRKSTCPELILTAEKWGMWLQGAPGSSLNVSSCKTNHHGMKVMVPGAKGPPPPSHS